MTGGAEQPTDEELLRAHVDGDRAAFGELFARHRDRLWAVALRTTGNPEDAADGLQDGLVAAYRRAASFRGDAAVTTWLHRVVVNACLDRLRAARVRRAEPLPAADHFPETDAALPHSVRPTDPADASVAADLRRRVLAGLAELPAEQRAALVLVDMEGYPVAEAASILGCAVGTVKSRCSRGRARLAVVLADVLADVLGEDHRRSCGPDSAGPESPGNLDPGAPVPSPRSPRAPPDGSG